MLKIKGISDLNRIYDEADTYGQDLFAEQRNNLLLVSGHHYNKIGQNRIERERGRYSGQRDQKLRLVKNHIQKISKIYKNNIISYMPSVVVSPKNDTELQDVKAAEHNNAVWEDIKTRHKLKRKMRQLISDYVDIGEMILKVGYDYQAGRFLGTTPVMDENGQPVLDQNGQPVEEPSFSGDHTFERVFGFNCLVSRSAESFEESPYVIIRKMSKISDLKEMVKGDEAKEKLINESPDERYKVFYGESGTFRDTKGMTMVREYYFRKCADYPNGYYFITTKAGILFEGELPLGLFPVLYAGFDEAPTMPRCYSIIKQLRPYQAEINRTGSKIAEHQITLGDDKLVLFGGSKIAHGGTAHGVKAINVTGSSPIVIPGRAGDQFVGYMQAQIGEMYGAANLPEDSEEKAMMNNDEYARLFMAAKDKKRFSLYVEKVQDFMIDLCEICLRYAKEYYTDEQLIPAIDKKEFVNVEEFRSSDDLSVKIVVEPASDDIETRMGKQLALNHAIQYVGPQLSRADIGMMLKSMPYGNVEGAFEELLMDSDDVDADILALDRGENVEVDMESNKQYVIRRLTNRMKKGDFRYLSEQIKANYTALRDQYRQLVTKEQQEAAMAQSGFIPTGGYLVGVDMFVDGGDGKAARRARIPYEALNWLVKKLESQGSSQAALNGLSMQDQAAIGKGVGEGMGQMNGGENEMSAGQPM